MNSFIDSLSGPALWLWWFTVVMGFLGAVIFPIAYQIGSKGEWRHSELGRHLMIFSLAVGYALLALLLRVVVGDYPGRTPVNFSALFGLVGVVWWRTVRYIMVWRKPREAEDHELV